MPKDFFLKKPIIKPKPWGREIWFAWTKKYAGKILEVKKGHRFSLQYHEKKMETQYVLKGKIKLTYGTNQKKLKSKILKTNDKIDIPPYTIHRVLALEKSVLFEVSTPELNDVVKIADDYGRTGKGNDENLDCRLHKKMTRFLAPSYDGARNDTAA